MMNVATEAKLVWTPKRLDDIPTSSFNRVIREERIGVMLHFDASTTDKGAMSWFAHPDCRMSYNFLALDDGSFCMIAPQRSRAWHAGRCRPSSDLLPYKDANSAFAGIAVATNQHHSTHYIQALTVAWLVWWEYQTWNWPINETWRIVGHESEAWPRGRKIDPTGTDRKRPILSVEGIRNLVPLFTL